MVDHLAVAKPEWRKELVEAKQIATQNLAKYPQVDDEDDEPPLAPIEYKPPSPSPSPPPKPPEPAMRPAKRRTPPPPDKISFSSVGNLFTGKPDKSFCKNMQEESDSE